jgi:CheY-like chemotaxis protein
LDDGNAAVVLVVEDETLVRLLANDILSEAGYRVLEAHDGQEALTVLEVHDDVRALFSDVNMPNVDGLSLAKIVAERWPHIAVVIASGVAEAPEGFRFLRKPYTAEAVVREVQAAIAETAVGTGSAVWLAGIPRHGATSGPQPLAEPEE